MQLTTAYQASVSHHQNRAKEIAFCTLSLVLVTVKCRRASGPDFMALLARYALRVDEALSVLTV